MCKCTPSKRTPWCGKPGCEAPEQDENLTTPRQSTEQEQDWIDEVLTRLENAVEHDVMRRVANRQTGTSPKALHAEARHAILTHLEAAKREGYDLALDQLVDWGEHWQGIHSGNRPFNWYRAAKALKVSKDMRLPYDPLSQTKEEAEEKNDA